jgi:hypothetical protein
MVECQLPKLKVASSILVARSNFQTKNLLDKLSGDCECAEERTLEYYIRSLLGGLSRSDKRFPPALFIKRLVVAR